MKKKKFESWEIVELCKKHQMFTCGTQRQYEKTFELAKNGITQTELAYILYVCSDYPLNTINEWISPLFEKGDSL